MPTDDIVPVEDDLDDDEEILDPNDPLAESDAEADEAPPDALNGDASAPDAGDPSAED